MSVSLLSTKLYIPPARANVIARPRLTEKLLDGAKQPGSITLLSGPAGFGKTTLLSEFVAQLQRAVAWVSLDEGDNDPIRFWTYLISACQLVQEGVGETALGLFRTPQPLPDDTIPTILINDIARLEDGLVLVLDDYHAIRNPAIHTTVAFLLDHLPASLHLVLSTRVDPPFPLARLRARNQLVEIRAQDLRFSVDEALEFLNRTMGLNLTIEEVAALEARTEGWIAGLQLAALSMQRRSDIPAFIQAFTGSHVYIAEYLMEEVLRQQPPDVQSFLLQTSILERLNAALSDALLVNKLEGLQVEKLASTFELSNMRTCQQTLEYLARSNLFIIPLDDEGQWFRYHHLFADLLRARLRQSLAADAIAALHQRAAVWYERAGMAPEAIEHALAAMDYSHAARLVEKYAYPFMTRGELTTCMQWMAALPEDVTCRRPQFVLAKAWALTFAGAFHQVEPLLQQVEVLIQKESDTSAGREMLGSACAMRAFFAMLAGEYERALELAERAESLSPEGSTGARSLLPYTLGAALRGQGQYEKAAQAFAREIQMGERFDDLLIWTTGITELINTLRMQGRLREAVETGRKALLRLDERGAAQFGSLAKVEVALCEVLREQNDLDEARERVYGAINRMQAWGMPTDRLFAYLVLARIQESQGDVDGARESLQIARELRDAHPVLMNLARAVDIYEIRLLLSTQNVAAAEQLLESLHPGTSRILVLLEQELIMLARLRLAQGRPDDATVILSGLASHPGIIERMSAWLEISVLQACALYNQGNRESALSVLIKSLALAEPEGFVRVFVEEGEVMQQLLVAVESELATATAQASIPLRAYVTNLLEAFSGSLIAGVTPRYPDEEAGLVEPLTSRELEVLQLIAAGDSNRTIAEKLVITVSAVKKHSANIYGKLNVNSRTQAVARARQLGLFYADE
jgi:ATP/maltotriose-dependent transcriptional regulator MalT